MVEKAVQSVRDELIEFDIDSNKVSSTLARDIDRRLAQLSRDLKKLLLDIDPHGTKQAPARQRRMAKLEKASRTVIRDAYADIRRMQKERLVRIGKVASQNAVKSMRKGIP